MLRRLRPARTLPQDQTGMVLIWFALGFIGFLAFLAIVVESGLIFLERRELQNTADAAALAGGQALLLDPLNAETTAEAYAADDKSGLVTNNATATTTTITQEVSHNSRTLFASTGLSFGEPEVHASATARIAATRLPGPGVFCVAVSLEEYISASGDLSTFDSLTLDWADLEPYETTLRFGAGQAGSNAGYIDILGDINENTRDCLENGSANPLLPQEETQTGISTGQASQALYERLVRARDRTDNDGRGCFTWDEVVWSIIAADLDLDGIADDGTWACNPLYNQDSAVVLMPVVNESFYDGSGTSAVNVHDQGGDKPYLMAMFFIDALRTFENVNVANWKFQTQGNGQGEIYGLFLTRVPTVLNPAPQGESGGVIICDPNASFTCFVQLVD